MMLRADAWVRPEGEELRTERVVIDVREVYRYQHCKDAETPGTVLWLESGGTPTVTMPFERFDALYTKHTDAPFIGGYD